MSQPADLRREYTLAGLRRADLEADPFRQFERWFSLAVESAATDSWEPNVMTLATADASGGPSSRIVLLKGFDAQGLRFFTNYGGRKGRELAENPRASVTFHWPVLERQLTVAGSVEKLPREESAAYFHSRPRGSQFGAAVSPQSEVIPDRAFLETRLAALEEQFAGQEIPLPEFWGGYLLRPARFEFWQGRRNRLHDRFQYLLTPENGWQMERLSP